VGRKARDVQPSAPDVYDFHPFHLLSSTDRFTSAAGRAGRNKSLTLGLDGTNPRFPWKPSTTMLTYRLNGTTEDVGVDRGEPSQCPTATAP
jgi:hypothetical protein